MAWGYRYAVGYEATPLPGGRAVQKGEFTRPIEGALNIGVQGLDVTEPCFFCEGGFVSRVANFVPGINGVSGLHDIFQINLGNGIWRDIFNIPGMPIAAAISYPAMLNGPLAVRLTAD
jgi:hypothetical protein